MSAPFFVFFRALTLNKIKGMKWVLGGIRTVSLHDTKRITFNDLSAHFYANETDVGKNRVEACFTKLAELNDTVKCSFSTEVLTEKYIGNFDVSF